MRTIFAVAAFCAAITVAAAADKSGVDFTTVLMGPNAEPIQQVGRDGKNENATLGDVALMALLSELPEDKITTSADVEKKWKRSQLAEKIYKKTAVVLAPEEISMIKDRIAKSASTAALGAAWPLLDPTLRHQN
jgi:ribosome-binding protein aMBF1 (putative translation factor)